MPTGTYLKIIENFELDMRVFIALSALLCGCNGLMFHSEAVTKEWDTWVFVENGTYYAYYLVTEVKKMYISSLFFLCPLSLLLFLHAACAFNPEPGIVRRRLWSCHITRRTALDGPRIRVARVSVPIITVWRGSKKLYNVK